MHKFQIKDRLGRKVLFGLSVLEPERNKYLIVVRQLDNYTGPSVTNAAEEIWQSLERFTGPSSRFLEFYPEEESLDEVILHRSDDGSVESVSWVQLEDNERLAILNDIHRHDKKSKEVT